MRTCRPIEREEVRTLPHLAVVAGVLCLVTIPSAAGELVEVLPFVEVGGLIEQYAAADVSFARADGHVVVIAVLPCGGIAEAGDDHAGGRQGDDGLGELGPVDELRVVGEGEALRLLDGVGVAHDGGVFAGAEFCAGVDLIDARADLERRTGEAAEGVGAVGRGGEGDGEVLPVEHVGADGVVPAHVSPGGGEGVVLKEHMVAAVVVDGAVGVVHPIVSR